MTTYDDTYSILTSMVIERLRYQCDFVIYR